MTHAYTIARLIVATLLFWAVAPHSYDYFTLLRIVVVCVSGYGIYLSAQRKREGWSWMFVGILILFNPIFKMPLSRLTWKYVDVAVGLFFVASIFLFKGSVLKDGELQ